MDFTRKLPVYETTIYVLIAIYAILMYRATPNGAAGQVPKIVLPLLLALTLFQLACTVSDTDSFFRQLLWQPFQRLTKTNRETNEIYEHSEADSESDTDLTDDILMIGWIIACYILVYFLGVVTGGFVFVLSFMISNDHSILRSGSVAGLLAGLLWSFSSILGIRFWSGIVILPKFITL